MKKTNLAGAASIALLTFALLPACSSLPRRSQAGAGSARIKSIEGNADVARGNGPWEAAHLWEKLNSGDRAKTGGNGKIDFSLGKFGGVLTLMPESMITFEQIGPASP